MKKYLLFIFLLLLEIQLVVAQQFPVQIIPQTIPPRPVLLSDYANATSSLDRVSVQLILNDLTELNREVRLKLFIEGQGINAESTDVIIGANPIFLEGGVTTTLGTAELAPYFDFQNLQGISPAVYGSSLPEGPYSFCFELFDAFTGNVVSSKTCTNFVLFDNDPPFLNLPLNAAGLQEMNPLNLVFQWTPRHINVSNVQYELIISELWDLNIDPQAAFLSSPPIFQTTTTQTTFIYDNTQPSLIPGRRYGWRVRAFASVNAEEIGLFTNNGFSEIFHFDYKSQCDDPLFPEIEELSNRSAKIAWQGDFDHLDYTLKYREKNAGSEWYDITTPREYVTVDDLKTETTYEYKVLGNCVFGSYGETLIQEFTTLSDEASAYQGCAIEPDPVILDNQEILPNLYPNDIFTAGDFPVTVLQVDNATAPFSGGGYVIVPWLGDTKISVAFTGIQINTDMKLLSGKVETTYDADWGNVEFIDDLFEVFEGDNDLTNISVDFDIPTDPDGAYEEYIVVNPDGTITITNPTNGNTVDYPGGDDVLIVDTNPDGTSDTFVIDENGNVTEGGPIAPGGPIDTQNTPGFDINGNITQLSATGIKVTFIDDAAYQYGYDKVPNEEYSNLSSVYDRITDVSGNDYDIIHKAIQKNISENVKATLEVDNDSIYNRLVFKTEQGILLPHTRDGNTLSIDVKGLFGFENELVYATLLPEQEGGQQTIAGSFRLWHLSEKEVNITIVRINNATLPSNYEQGLNDIYNKAAVNFTYANVIDYSPNPSLYGGDNTIQVGESGFLENYTSEQSAIISNFKSTNSYDVNTYYLFVFGSDIQPSRAVAGFMPLKRQFGFIFDPNDNPEENTNDRVKIMAHELGHGIFGLEHPFTLFNTTEGGTDWLMDYGDGRRLVHTDWAQIHNPDFQLYLFQDDEEGEFIPSDKNMAQRFFEGIKASIVYLSQNNTQQEINTDNIVINSENDIAFEELEEVIVVASNGSNLTRLEYEGDLTTSDDFTFNVKLVLQETQSFVTSTFLESISSPQYQFNNSTHRKYFFPYGGGSINNTDSELLSGNTDDAPDTPGITIMIENDDISSFENAIFDFQNNVNSQQNWITKLNESVVGQDTENLQKYPVKALILSGLEARLKLIDDWMTDNMSGANWFNNTFGVDDEESIFLAVLKSVIRDQIEEDNTTLLFDIVNGTTLLGTPNWLSLNDAIDSGGDNNQLFFNVLSVLALNSDQTEVLNLLNGIGNDWFILDSKEKLFLSILRGIEPINYPNYIQQLRNNDYEQLKTLSNKVHNSFIIFGGNNYNSFLQAMSNILSNSNDEEKLEILSEIAKERCSDMGEAEKGFFGQLFTSFSEFSNNTQLGLLTGEYFVELLDAGPITSNTINICGRYTDINIIVEIAKLRAQYPEQFSKFTQMEDWIWLRESDGQILRQTQNARNWTKPYVLNYYINNQSNNFFVSGTENLVDFYAWSDYLNINPNVYDLFDSNFQLYLETFKQVFEEFAQSNENSSNDDFWNSLSINNYYDFNEAMYYISTSESQESISNAPNDKRELVVQKFCDFISDVPDVNVRLIYNKTFLKLASSFSSEDTDILRTLAFIGFEKIENKLVDGEDTARFMVWLGGQIISSGLTEPLVESEILNSDGSVKSTDDFIGLEQNTFSGGNVNADLDEFNRVTLDNVTYPYNKLIPVSIVGDFTFLDKTFRQGDILTIPAIQIYAMSEHNAHEVAVNQAWYAFDVISFAFGAGEVKVLLKAGNYARKFIVVSDLIGSTAELVVNALDVNTIPSELRSDIQMLSIVASIPSMATSFRSVDNIVTRTDNAINNLAGMSPNQKSALVNYFSRVKAKFPPSAENIARLEDILNATGDGFDALRVFHNSLSDELKAIFIGDFSRMPLDKLEDAMNTPRYFDGWRNFRTKYPTKYLCTN